MVRQSAPSRGRKLSQAVACINADSVLPAFSGPSGMTRRAPLSRWMWPASKISFFISLIMACMVRGGEEGEGIFFVEISILDGLS